VEFVFFEAQVHKFQVDGSMKLAIITQVVHKKFQQQIWAYAPYVKEINLWTNPVDEVLLVAPCIEAASTPIDLAYTSDDIQLRSVPSFSLQGIAAICKAMLVLPVAIYQIQKAMRAANHIHLRCPGNMGLLGCIVQIFFPKKIKTAKYAGNWDPNAKQPWSYNLQCWILQNTFLTRNMTVLVYGEWPNRSSNIRSFFTASYRESDKKNTPPRQLVTPLQCLFVGSLTAGKNPLYAIQLVEALANKGIAVELKLYGDGALRAMLESYCLQNNLSKWIQFYGNQDAAVVQKAYESSHFLILPSQSEGWPKAVAEAMFWGCVPLVSAVSCVPNMLHNQSRGLLLTLNIEQDVHRFIEIIQQPAVYQETAMAAQEWSRHFTLDRFELEISKLLEQ
jgi:glycosyltransferase involved in cell wall biosynthesis